MEPSPNEDHELLSELKDEDEWMQSLLKERRGPAERSDLGRLLMEEPVTALNPPNTTIVLPEDTVEHVVRAMCDDKASAVMVAFQDKLVGVFTERNFLTEIAHRYSEVKHEPIRKFMVKDPEHIQSRNSVAYCTNWMAVKRYRHVPVVDGQKPLAMACVLDVLRYVSERIAEE